MNFAISCNLKKNSIRTSFQNSSENGSFNEAQTQGQKSSRMNETRDIRK